MSTIEIEGARESPLQRIRISTLDLHVTPMTADEVVSWIERAPGKALLLNHNLHSAYLHTESATFRELYARADRVVIDGAPILWFAKRASKEPFQGGTRIGSTDWIERLPSLKSGANIAIFGATEESNAAAVAKLTEDLRETECNVFGLDGYTSWESAVAWLHEIQPSLVLVGLGMPRQEAFLSQHWDELPPAVYATVGGAIDYVGGHNKLAPRWVGGMGLEWAWRLAHEPRRLAHRYLVEPVLLARALWQNRRRRANA